MFFSKKKHDRTSDDVISVPGDDSNKPGLSETTHEANDNRIHQSFLGKITSPFRGKTKPKSDKKTEEINKEGYVMLNIPTQDVTKQQSTISTDITQSSATTIPHKSQKSFLDKFNPVNIFGYKDESKILNADNVIDNEVKQQRLNVSFPEVDLSKKFESTNFCICMVIGLTFLMGVLRCIRHYVFGYDESQFLRHSTYRLPAALLIIGLVAHRIAAFILGVIIRRILSKTFKYTGRFDIHIGWISYRGIFDGNQLIIRNIVWRNPPGFANTPYFMYCKRISMSVTITDILNFIIHRDSFKLDEIFIDGLEVFVERSDTVKLKPTSKRHGLNVWYALGKEEKEDNEESVNAFLVRVYKRNINKAKNNIMSNIPIVNIFTNNTRISDTSTAPLTNVLIESLSTTRNPVPSTDIMSQITSSKTPSGRFPYLTRERSPSDPVAAKHDAKHTTGLLEDENDNDNMSDVDSNLDSGDNECMPRLSTINLLHHEDSLPITHTNTQTSSHTAANTINNSHKNNHQNTSIKSQFSFYKPEDLLNKQVKKPVTIELNRFVMLNLKTHIVDLFVSKHVPPSDISDIVLPYVELTHKDFLGPAPFETVNNTVTTTTTTTTAAAGGSAVTTTAACTGTTATATSAVSGGTTASSATESRFHSTKVTLPFMTEHDKTAHGTTDSVSVSVTNAHTVTDHTAAAVTTVTGTTAVVTSTGTDHTTTTSTQHTTTSFTHILSHTDTSHHNDSFIHNRKLSNTHTPTSAATLTPKMVPLPPKDFANKLKKGIEKAVKKHNVISFNFVMSNAFTMFSTNQLKNAKFLTTQAKASTATATSATIKTATAVSMENIRDHLNDDKDSKNGV